MILLHNPQDKASREFLEKYGDKFDEVVEYPKCVEVYPGVSHFPAVVLNVPEMVIDYTLYGVLSRIPDYRHLGIRVKDGYKKYGQCAVLPVLEQYSDRKKFKESDIEYLVDAANDGMIPAYWISAGILIQDRFDDPCPNDLSDDLKKRSTRTLDESDGLIVKVMGTTEIIYPDTIDECYTRLEQYRTWKEKLHPTWDYKAEGI